jgi:S1/P1 Nuclease
MSRSRFGGTVLCLVMTFVFLVPAECRAWGAEAHMIVALVADRLLQAQEAAAARKIPELLAGDKSGWTKTDITGEATWADAVLEKTTEGRIATMKWHYVRLDPANPDITKACFGKPALPSMAPASFGVQDDCVVDKIEQFAKELHDAATLPGERLKALQFLLNFVGDVHDPLNAIDHKDQGGQCTAIEPPGAKTPVRLRAYWDDTLVIEALGKDPAKAAGEIVAGLTPADIQKWSGGTPADWAQESYNVAKDVAYSFAKEAPREAAAGKSQPSPARKGEKDACGPAPLYHVDAAYRDRAIAAVKEQLAKAGVRLASLLRDNLQ